MSQDQQTPIVFGAAYSVYVRIVRLALEEKGVAYRLDEIDVFAADGPPPGYLERHPFGRIPAFEHGSLRLYEAAAICRYVDEAFDGPRLTPTDLAARALMAQTIGMLDSYAYRALVWDVYVELVAKPRGGGTSDPERVAAGLRTAGTVVRVLENQLAGHGHLAGDGISLADLHAWPMIDCVLLTDPGRVLVEDHGRLAEWAQAMAARPASRKTA